MRHHPNPHASAAPLRNRPGDVVGPVREGTPIGDPEACIRALKWWEEVGVDRMVFLINTGETIPNEKVLASLRLFASEVIPAGGIAVVGMPIEQFFDLYSTVRPDMLKRLAI